MGWGIKLMKTKRFLIVITITFFLFLFLNITISKSYEHYLFTTLNNITSNLVSKYPESEDLIMNTIIYQDNSLNILPKYSPTIPNNNICTPEKNNTSNIIAWKASIGTLNRIHFIITYMKYMNNAKNVGIAQNVDIRNGDVVNDVIPSIAK